MYNSYCFLKIKNIHAQYYCNQFKIGTPLITEFVPHKKRNNFNFYNIVKYFLSYKKEFVFLPKQSQKFRSLLQDRSRYLGLFRKGKTHTRNSISFMHMPIVCLNCNLCIKYCRRICGDTNRTTV